MTIKTRKRLLSLAILMLWGLGACVLFWGQEKVKLPESGLKAALRKLPAVTDNNSAKLVTPLSVAEFQSTGKKPLRQRLYDPPPPPKVEKKPPPPKQLNASLVATIIEPNKSTAMMKVKNQYVFRTIGEVVDPDIPEAVIEEIHPDHITIRRGNQTEKMLVPGTGK